MDGEKIWQKSVGLRAARQIADAQGNEWTEIFARLRKKRSLSLAIRQMNELANDPEHGPIVREAFKRMGLQ